MQARPAVLADVPSITTIYNQGIEDRTATFETRPRTTDDVKSWFEKAWFDKARSDRASFNAPYPIAVVEKHDRVIAFAAASAYRPRLCYRGIAEVSVYVHREFRRRGAGRLALSELIRIAESDGYWKLISRVFPENRASRSLIASLGFREVGIYEKHGRLDGIWRDVVIVERLIPANLA